MTDSFKSLAMLSVEQAPKLLLNINQALRKSHIVDALKHSFDINCNFEAKLKKINIVATKSRLLDHRRPSHLPTAVLIAPLHQFLQFVPHPT